MDDTDTTNFANRSQPITIDGIRGWYMPGRTKRGVVMCGTIGFEQLAAYRGWYALAEEIGATGCAVLRFDYPGEGDSHDIAVQHADVLIDSILRAAKWMREVAGVEEVALVGFRLGATLAAVAAKRISAERVALVAPFISGRRYNREMRNQAKTLGMLADGSPMPQPADHLIVGGFRFDPLTAVSLEAIDLAAEPAPAQRTFLSGLGSELLARNYIAQGVEVTVAPFAALAPIMGRPADTGRSADFSALVQFVAQDTLPGLVGDVSDIPTPIIGSRWVETIEEISGAVAVRCTPTASPIRARVLFLNAGANMRSGWGRQVTQLSRVLADEGLMTVRVDLPGIGDSRGNVTDNFRGTASVGHVLMIVDALATDESPLIAAGVCSGADLAWCSLCEDSRIDAALMLNPAVLEDTGVVAGFEPAFRSTNTYWRMLRKPSVWRRVITRQVQIGPIFTALARRASTTWHRRGGDKRVLRQFHKVRSRGQTVSMVFSEGDVGIAQVQLMLGGKTAQVVNSTGGTLGVVAGTDHNFGGDAGQAAISEGLRALVERLENLQDTSTSARKTLLPNSRY
jgi:alpha/beta superfamily hydrolase